MILDIIALFLGIVGSLVFGFVIGRSMGYDQGWSDGRVTGRVEMGNLLMKSELNGTIRPVP